MPKGAPAARVYPAASGGGRGLGCQDNAWVR